MSDIHTPRAHARHTDGVPCGCVTDLSRPAVLCQWCWAAYVPEEIVEFPVWRCYDCGGGVDTNPRAWGPIPA